MYRTPNPAYQRACDCRCPLHHGQLRSTYNDPGCHCLTICASQPMTLLTPQITGALFLDRDDVLWFVPGLEPGHWDWRNATPVNLAKLAAALDCPIVVLERKRPPGTSPGTTDAR